MTKTPEYLTNFNDWPIWRSYEALMSWFDEVTNVVPPMVPGFEDKGDTTQVVYSCDPKEVQQVTQRMQMLEDLMDLRSPLPWAEVVHMRGCPCGMTNTEWKAFTEYSDDPMGDHHGRNM